MTNINQYFFKGLVMDSNKDIVDVKMKKQFMEGLSTFGTDQT